MSNELIGTIGASTLTGTISNASLTGTTQCILEVNTGTVECTEYDGSDLSGSFTTPVGATNRTLTVSDVPTHIFVEGNRLDSDDYSGVVSGADYIITFSIPIVDAMKVVVCI